MAVFEQAAQYLREKGWIKGDLGGNSGPACLLGACYAQGYLHVDAQHALGDVVREQYPDRLEYPGMDEGNSIVANFNDHPDTTLEDVVTVLEKAEARFNERV